ncbi:hypothetical protein [Georgenia faecalis]|uniref:Rod shape-determining protein MreD n=1 Tax=Georgenia faecalis TaxID=2483799 RepID=A0ABV9D870_9MICO|nr:hypothetical protein [Georgenia faecalis]
MSAPADRTRIVTGRAVPGWSLRLALAVTVLGCAALVVDNSAQVAIAVALAAGLAWRPDGALAALTVALLAGMLLVGVPGPLSGQASALVLGTHALLRLASLAGATGARARVEVGVLAAEVRPFVGIQALAQLLALGGGLLAASAPVPWFAAAAAAGLVVVAWATLVPMLAATGRRAPR